ncbi:MAG TPA: FAD-dependent oxidoreductase [Acidimicrobiia bacterium]|nr:FAD-dependent oxidoreductase [Acidimicrobiia bacterium]
MSDLDTVVIVGASLAGLRAAETLRRVGFGGRVTVVGEEPRLPYDRPPLTKEFLAGEWEPERLVLRANGYDDLDVEWELDRRAVRLDVEGRALDLHDGQRLAYDGLVIATGASPRLLPDAPRLAGIFTLRTLDDALAVRELLDSNPKVVVIGAGFIGAEVAATCRKRGLDVTVLEMLPQPMVRGVGTVIGETLAGLHRDHGVDLRCGVRIEAIEGDGRVQRVRLADGAVIEADVLLVAIGVTPNTEWLDGSGLTIDNGVVCDETLLAAPGVVAAGDVARWPNPLFDGELMRLEHWTNATEQGVAAAQRLLAAEGEAQPFAPVPFVWSDQYDVKIQSAGRFSGEDDMQVVDGSLEERRFVAVFGRAGRLSGVIAFSRPRLLMQYRMMIAQRTSFDDALAHPAG